MIFMADNSRNLVASLRRDGYLKTPEIIEAFLKIDRVDFVPENLKSDAYLNIPLSIGEGQTISQPLTVAFMLELLQPKFGDRIFDVGAGSSWTSALMAYIVGKKGRVFAIEMVPELCDFGRENVEKYGFIKNGIVDYICGDGSLGLEKEAPFDKILVSAAAEKIPIAWRKQLKIGGTIVAPVKNSIIRIIKRGKNKFEEKEFYGFSFVPLIA